MPRYTKLALDKVVEQLEQWVEATDTVRSVEEDKDYPDGYRVDELSTRIDAMESAVISLQEIE